MSFLDWLFTRLCFLSGVVFCASVFIVGLGMFGATPVLQFALWAMLASAMLAAIAGSFS